jgi:hypothetical protein
VFTELAKGPQDGESLRTYLDHPRSVRDFFNALVSLGMLQRNNDKYANTPESDLFLDRAKSSYIGGLLEMCNARLYGFWGNLTTGLKTGELQNEAKRGEDFFAAIYYDPARLKQFLSAMTDLSMGVANALALQFPWANYKSFVDAGGAQGCVPVQIALAHPHLAGRHKPVSASRARIAAAECTTPDSRKHASNRSAARTRWSLGSSDLEGMMLACVAN